MLKFGQNATALHQSPFAILGATLRDDRRRIIELAEDQSLKLEHDVCQKARSDLTNLRTRLSAEIAWLPGISPRKANQLLNTLIQNPIALREESGLPTLAHLNLLAAAFEFTGDDEGLRLPYIILRFAFLAEQLNPEEVLREVNEDRFASGFQEVRYLDQIEKELAERKRYYRNTINDALNRLSTKNLVQVMTRIVRKESAEQSLWLIDDLVDSYEVELQDFLQKETENAQKLIKAIRDSAVQGEPYIKIYVDKLEDVARNWSSVVCPIQVSAKARGIDHEPSRDFAYSIRSLAIDLFNNHDMMTQAQRLTALLQDVFSEIPDVSDCANQDADALIEIEAKRIRAEDEAKQRELEWERSIRFSTDVGVVFKDNLAISKNGIEWKGKTFPLDSIIAVRWGAVRNTVNGIPTGTDYEIAFTNPAGVTSISLRKESSYSGFVEVLWRAVCIRLLFEMIESLKAGDVFSFGNMTVRDEYVIITESGFLRSDKNIRLTWDEVLVWSSNGEFVIQSKHNERVCGSASYKDHWNVHILDHLVRLSLKEGCVKLSNCLKNE